MTEDTRRRVHRLQNWLIALAAVVVFLGVAAPLAVVFYVQGTANENQLSVTCTSAKANIEQLEALDAINDNLRQFADQLGVPFVPVEVQIPEVPSECVESS